MFVVFAVGTMSGRSADHAEMLLTCDWLRIDISRYLISWIIVAPFHFLRSRKTKT